MNALSKIITLPGLIVLLSACAHYPRQYGYYPDNASYGGGYTVMQRSYYGGAPNPYRGYHSGREYFDRQQNQYQDSRRFPKFPGNWQQHNSDNHHRSHDAGQGPRQQHSDRGRDDFDYTGSSQTRRPEQMRNRGDHQPDHHQERQTGKPHRENRDRDDHDAEQRVSEHGRSNRWSRRDDHVNNDRTFR